MPFKTSADSWVHIVFEYNAGMIIKCSKKLVVYSIKNILPSLTIDIPLFETSRHRDQLV